MIFSNFVKPKWQHRNPDVRQLEIESLDDPAILNEVAQYDEAAEVRQAAIKKIKELDLLAQIAQQDKDSSVRELAEQRLKKLLCCQTNDCPPLDTRLTWLSNTTDAEVIAYTAVHGLEVDLRLAAISQVEREELLGDIAINDRRSEVRFAAVEKLTQKSILERVIKAVRNNDKRVSRRAREKLDDAIEQMERPMRILAECEAICTKLDSLEHRLNPETSSVHQSLVDAIDESKTLKPENAEFKRLQERWFTIATDADTQCQARFDKAQQKVKTAFENYQQALLDAKKREQARMPMRVAKKELCEQMEGLLIDLKKRQSIGGEDEKALSQRLSALSSQWAETAKIDEPDEEQQWQARFERASQSVQKRLQKLQASYEMICQLQTINAQADSLLNGTETIKPEQLKNFQARWEAVSEPDKSLPLFSELNSHFDNTLKALQTRWQELKDQRKQVVHGFKQLLKEIETALDNGELKNAIPLEQQARDLFNTTDTLSTGKENAALLQRLQTCTAKINDLRSWQRWGNKLEREKLCEQVESLLETEDDNSTEELARLTEEAQTAWKRLGSSGYSRDIWDRFHQACQTAYQRYREHLCRQIENLSEQEPNNPEETARTIRQAQTTWRNLGSQGHSQELWERFNQVCQTAYEPCKSYFNIKAHEREQNCLQKQALCERLEAYADNTDWENPDWKEVYQFVRGMDKAWRNVGTTDRKYKKAIQQRFQRAMQVLETHLEVERQGNCRYRLRLTGQVEELARHLSDAIEAHKDANNPEEVENKITQAIEEVKHLQKQWQVTVSGNRRVEREFWQVFRNACDVVFNHRKQQQEAHKKELQAYLESKIALCQQAEALATLEGEAIKTAPSLVKQFQEAWTNIKKEDRNKAGIGGGLRKKVKATEAVEERFNRACQQVEMRYQAQLTAERRYQLDLLKQKVVFCVELEQAETLARLQAQEEPDCLETVQAAWAELSELDNANLEALMAQRFQQACAAAATGEENVSEETLKNKKTLCIRMEILAGIESPPDAAEDRLAYQVARLSAAMSRGEKKQSLEPHVEAEKIERSWYLSAAPSDQTLRLEQRFSKACEILRRMR
ncbi:MAG: hypothetical protein DRR19_04715 [Candidatus Parabeggiatoa sp. nov. 1]|nr:MAG: hypothetical protein DRR19_04715 [Gammaproteobacteria bacterium]